MLTKEVKLKGFLLASICVCFGINIGLQRTSGLFFIYFQDDFNATATQISLVIALPVAGLFLGGPLYAITFKKFGVLTTFALSSVLSAVAYLGTSFSQTYIPVVVFHILLGIGYGLGHMAAFTTTGTVFKRARSMANNALYSSSIITGIAASPVVQTLITEYTWRGVLLLLAAVALNQIPFGYIASMLHKEITHIKTSKEAVQETCENTEHSDTVTDQTTVPKVTKDPIFYIYCLSNVGMYTFQIVTMQYLVRYAQDIGIDDESAAAMLSAHFIANLCTSVASGLLSALDVKSQIIKKYVTTVNYMMLLCVLEAVVMVIPIANETREAYFVYMILFGILSGGVGAFPISLIPQLFGVAELPIALGLRSVISGIFALAIPPFIGYLVDQSGNYKPVQHVSATMLIIGGCLLFFVNRRIAIRRRNEK